MNSVAATLARWAMGAHIMQGLPFITYYPPKLRLLPLVKHCRLLVLTPRHCGGRATGTAARRPALVSLERIRRTGDSSFAAIAGFGVPVAQDYASDGIHVMNLLTHGADNGLVDVGILRHIFSSKALNSMSCLWATI